MKTVLFFHAVVGFIVPVSLIHCCYWAFKFRKGDYSQSRAQLRLSSISCGLFVCALITGLILVPSFEKNVEPQLISAGQETVISLFRLKFLWGVTACVLCLATAAYRVSFDPQEDPQRLGGYLKYIATLAAAAVVVAVIGIIVTITRPV